MAIPVRYVLVVVFLFTSLFLTFRIGNLPTLETLVAFKPSPSPSHHFSSLPDLKPHRANATFVMLCRNDELDGVIESIQSVEDRFNREHGYPYVFLNEEPFEDEFIKRVSVLSSAPMEFALVPRDHWDPPSWIDEQKAAEARQKMQNENVIYGGSLPYRNMCRFNSGFFFRQPMLQKYRYYWRVEPHVRFHCDVLTDPLRFMQDNNKTYGFTMSMYEFDSTVRTLWKTVKEFTESHPEAVNPHNALGFISDDDGENYNYCHFWSNFEIADMDFWRGETYMSYFEFLDKAGGFYYERWGDAPVHSIAAALFLPRTSIHFFDDIGYQHAPYMHCPADEKLWAQGRCSCDPANSFDHDGYSCLPRWENII